MLFKLVSNIYKIKKVKEVRQPQRGEKSLERLVRAELSASERRENLEILKTGQFETAKFVKGIF